jgi:hypothetical protein
MRSEEALDLDELLLEEAPDTMTAMLLPDLRRYVDEDVYDDEVHGMRSLLEHPEALATSLRSQMH